MNFNNLKKDYFAQLRAVINDYMAEFKEVYKTTLLSHDRKATGNLINSISTTLKVNGDDWIVTLKVADYWYYIDKGRKAGKRPPLAPIIKWIEAKPILPRPMANGKLPTTNQLAFLIARKIGNEGTKGTNDLQTTIDQVNAKYIPLLQSALESEWYEYQLDILHTIESFRV